MIEKEIDDDQEPEDDGFHKSLSFFDPRSPYLGIRTYTPLEINQFSNSNEVE